MPLPVLLLASLLRPAGGDATPPSPQRFRLDPLQLALVVEAFGVIARDDNPLWPGWNAHDTPVLLYLPQVQEALLRHPHPPEGFRRVDSPLLPEGWTLDLRDLDAPGVEGIFTLDGQNTSTSVAGIETLVVADPLSNLRPSLVQLLGDARPVRERERALTPELLSADPYDQLGMVVHEAFHVHQARLAPNKGASEAWLLQYPWLAAENNALFALEGRALERALRAEDEERVFEAALEWLGLRELRRATLPAQAVAYEDGTEFNEGLAKYVEWRAASAFEGRAETGPLRWARGFHGFADLGFWRERLLAALRANTGGETIVNGDPYGSGNLRFRLYTTGMAIGGLLDRLGADGWQERMLAEPEVTLTGIAREVLVPDASELRAAAERAKARDGYETELRRTRALEEAGAAAARTAAEGILSGPALFTLDFSGVETQVGLNFTPFGLTRVDATRTIYGQIPLHGELLGVASFQQDSTSPVLLDTGAKRLSFQLAAPVDAAGLAKLAKVAKLGSAPLDELELDLPGVTVHAKKAVLSAAKGGVELKLVR